MYIFFLYLQNIQQEKINLSLSSFKTYFSRNPHQDHKLNTITFETKQEELNNNGIYKKR